MGCLSHRQMKWILAYGMVGLVKSMLQGYGWLKSLWSGPVTKKRDVPRPRLEMIPPPVSPAQVALAKASCLDYQPA